MNNLNNKIFQGQLPLGRNRGDNLVAILLEGGALPARHQCTKTFGDKLNGGEKNRYFALRPEEALKEDVEDLIKILKEDQVWNANLHKPLMEEIITKNKMYFPNVFKGDININ